MAHGDIYVLRNEATVSTAITVLQALAGSACGFEIIEAGATQRGSTTSDSESIALVRKTAAATVTAATVGGTTGTLFKVDPNTGNPQLTLSTSGTGVTATAEGTDSDVILKEAFNVLNGWLHAPAPEARIWVPPSGIIALKFLTAPASQLWQFWMKLREL